MIPSKELYIEVMNIKNEFERFTDYYEKGVIDSFYEKDNTIYMTIFHQSKQDVKGRGAFVPFNINIYELAHKCKEWAKLKYFIDIDSHCDCARWGAEATSHNGRPSVFYKQVFIGRTEPEAIFKATSYIMEQLKQKD